MRTVFWPILKSRPPLNELHCHFSNPTADYLAGGGTDLKQYYGERDEASSALP